MSIQEESTPATDVAPAPREPEALVAVAPDKFIPARPEALWTPGAQAGLYEVMSLRQALTTRWATDAHFVTCVARSDLRADLLQPRFRKDGGALDEIRSHGYDIVHYVTVADVDTVGHTPVTCEQIEDASERLASRADLTWYPTRAGLRIVKAHDPSEPLSPEQHEAYVPELLSELRGLLGERWKVDDACLAWNWNFRLPFVIRDGKATSAPFDGPVRRRQHR